MKKFTYYTGLLFFTALLFILHTAFAFSLLPIFTAKGWFNDLFVSINGFDFKTYIPYIFGIVFSIATAAILSAIEKKDQYFWRFVTAISILELSDVALLCYPYHGNGWMALSGIYYGLYILSLVIFYAYIKAENIEPVKELQQNSSAIADKKEPAIVDLRQTYFALRKKGYSCDDAAKQLNLKPYQKSRFEKKWN